MQIIKFETTDCPSCKILEKILTKLLEEYPSIEIKHADVLKDKKHYEMAENLKINNFPTLAILDDNATLVSKLYGVRSMTTIKDWFKTNGVIQ